MVWVILSMGDLFISNYLESMTISFVLIYTSKNVTKHSTLCSFVCFIYVHRQYNVCQ